MPKNFRFFGAEFFYNTHLWNITGWALNDGLGDVIGILGMKHLPAKILWDSFLGGMSFWTCNCTRFLERNRKTRCFYAIWWFLWLVKYMDNEKIAYFLKVTHPRSQRIQTSHRLITCSDLSQPCLDLHRSKSGANHRPQRHWGCFVGDKHGRGGRKYNWFQFGCIIWWCITM